MIHFYKKRKGFTLLELMIVVIIVGILATMAIPRFIKARMTAYSAEAITNLGMLRQASWRYYLIDNTMPGNIINLDIDHPSNVPGAKFSYTIDDSTYPTFKLKAEYNKDTTRYITMDKDATIGRVGF